MSKNSQLLGFICGLIGPVIGMFIYYLLQLSHIPLQTFVTGITDLPPEIWTALLSLGTVFNLAIFFGFMQFKLYLSARGVILATFMYVLAVILIKFI